jgi:hypothetical protein
MSIITESNRAGESVSLTCKLPFTPEDEVTLFLHAVTPIATTAPTRIDRETIWDNIVANLLLGFMADYPFNGVKDFRLRKERDKKSREACWGYKGNLSFVGLGDSAANINKE